VKAALNRLKIAAVAAVTACAGATAAAASNYTWFGWQMTDTDYAIAHGTSNDPTDNDFYLICKGGQHDVELDVRAVHGTGYKGQGANNVPTTFAFADKRLAATAFLVGPEEMLGGVSIQYMLGRDDPILAAIAQGAPFTVQLPKIKSQIFSPAPAAQFFVEMTSFCKPGS
jgi:hypothetical protein